ncbi:MAG: uncharacterized membrane protein YidH (DUF202 family) [Psychromonas sp.]|jgi:uncharacterized membrane protein YidH (DUF202 family)|uniref:O-antigen ligase family protein n=1 Tax=Psychromonas sp. TaxID=1884585 RepID=UPI0039E33586
MVRIATILILLAALFMLSSAPWLSGVLYLFFSILQPQYVWFWSFDGLAIFKLSAGLAILAWLVKAAKGDIDFNVYKHPLNYALLVLTVFFNLSNLFSSYNSDFQVEVFTGIFNTIVLMYFIVLGLITDEKSLKYCCYAFIITGLYFTYWSNMAYLTSDWSKFPSGRLAGPGGSPYQDGNKFATLLVVTMPFLLFGIFYFKNKLIQLTLLLGIPLLWHAIFLTSSRGALLSVGVATIFSAFIVRSKKLNMLLVVGFCFALITQGGPMLARSLDTVNQAENLQKGQVVNPRVLSWKVGSELALKFPVFGVGVQRFRMAAVEHFPGESPHVAHNTFLNFAANCGILAGLMYLYFFYKSYKIFKQVYGGAEKDSIHYYLMCSCMASLIGFFVAALFLDLIIFEPLYIIIMLIVATRYHFIKVNRDINTTPDTVGKTADV